MVQESKDCFQELCFHSNHRSSNLDTLALSLACFFAHISKKLVPNCFLKVPNKLVAAAIAID